MLMIHLHLIKQRCISSILLSCYVIQLRIAFWSCRHLTRKENFQKGILDFFARKKLIPLRSIFLKECLSQKGAIWNPDLTASVTASLLYRKTRKQFELGENGGKAVADLDFEHD